MARQRFRRNRPSPNTFRKSLVVITSGWLLLSILATSAAAIDLQGRLSSEANLFLHAGNEPQQSHINGSIALETELFHEFSQNATITITPYFRLDSTDRNRSHGDLRIGSFFYQADNWQIAIGFDKVFWGVTEFTHLVDIINQTDLIDAFDGEEKLGQPMVHLTTVRDWGTLEAFLLPYFRERTFPGKRGRLRGANVVNQSSRFESSAGRYHLDGALRYSHTYGNWDIGIYHFLGTSREPLFLETDNRLLPYYQQISQSGTDLQFTYHQWLVKLEALYQTNRKKDGGAITFGFEYTFFSVLDSAMDIGLIGEYVQDERVTSQYSLYDDDFMIGARFTTNSQNSAELLLGMTHDTGRGSDVFLLEYSQRVGNSFKLELSGSLFGLIKPDDPAYALHKDSYVQAIVTYYF